MRGNTAPALRMTWPSWTVRTASAGKRPSVVANVRQLGNFRYILIPEIINKFMTNISDPVRTKYVHVFKLNLK
jgi:hypothetical protein